MKVYGWQGFRSECKTHHHSTREIVAAKSMAEVARIVGVKSPNRLFNICETGNDREIAIATAKPGTVFWKPINGRCEDYTEQAN